MDLQPSHQPEKASTSYRSSHDYTRLHPAYDCIPISSLHRLSSFGLFLHERVLKRFPTQPDPTRTNILSTRNDQNIFSSLFTGEILAPNTLYLNRISISIRSEECNLSNSTQHPLLPFHILPSCRLKSRSRPNYAPSLLHS